MYQMSHAAETEAEASEEIAEGQIHLKTRQTRKSSSWGLGDLTVWNEGLV